MTPAEEWARCKGWIASALPYGGNAYNIEDIEAAIASGAMVFLPGKHCAVVLEVATFPNYKILDVFLGGGEKGGKAMHEYCTAIEPYLDFFAKQTGCKKIRHFCRPGSERLAAKLGYEKLCSVVVREVRP